MVSRRRKKKKWIKQLTEILIIIFRVKKPQFCGFFSFVASNYYFKKKIFFIYVNQDEKRLTIRVDHNIFKVVMSKMILYLFYFFCISTLLAAQSGSNRTDTNIVTVRSAISLAVQQNPALRILKAEIDKKRGELKSNSGLVDPVISYGREGIGNSSFTSYDEQRIGITQEIEFPTKTSTLNKSINTAIESLELEYKNKTLLLREEIKKLYSELQYGLEMLHLAENEFQISQQLLEAVNLKYTSGEATKTELLKAKIQADEARNSISEATNNMHRSRYSLFNVIGLETSQQKYSIKFPDTLYYEAIEISQDDILSSFVSMPGVLAKMKSIESAKNYREFAGNSFYPNFSLSLFGQDMGSGFKSFGFEVGFSVPLWFSMNQNGKIEEATANIVASEEKYREELLLMKKEVEIAWHGYEAANENIGRFIKGILSDSEELLRLTTEGYQLGEIDFLNLLEAQRTYLSSSKRYYGYLLDYQHRLIELERFSDREFLYNE